MHARSNIAVLLTGILLSAAVEAAPQYQIFDLGVVAVGDTASQGVSVSPAGVAVGRSLRSGGGQAFSWTQGGGLVGLPNLAGRNFAVANDANDNGIVVGTAATTSFGSGRLPVMWQGGVVTQLPLPSGETLGDANGVNASNVAVGSVSSGITQHGVIYNAGSATAITQTTANNERFVTAFGISNSGRIVGQGTDAGFVTTVAIVYDMGSPQAFLVGALPGQNGGIAFAVSDAGHVVGSSTFNGGSGVPFIWTQATGIVAVPLATGTSEGSARGVNSAGWVVGQDSSAFSIPFVWDGTTTYRLADLLPPGSGWDLSMNTSSSALGISDDGVIVGTGVHNGETHGYAMVPVGGASPTPSPTPSVTPGPSATPSTTPAPSATPSTTPNEPHFEVSAPGIVAQNESFNITVTAKLFNNVLTTYTGTVHFTSTASTGAHLPPDSTLTNGVGTFSVTFDVPGNYTITARDTVNPSMIGTSGTIFVAVIDPGTPPPSSPTPSPTASPTATPTPTLAPPTPTPTASPTATPAQAINLSTRMRVQTADNVGIGGFIITGLVPRAEINIPTGSGVIPKHVLIRAIGPSLTGLGVPGALADPVLELHGTGSFVTITNDNWHDDPAQAALIMASGIPPTNNLESAIDATLNPGSYTAVVRGKDNTTGVALVEIYDLDPAPALSKLANISTRAFDDTGDNIIIAGFMLGGASGGDQVVLRGIGPSLTGLGVPNALANPQLELRDSNGALLRTNDNWQDDAAQAAALTAAGLGLSNDLESGIAATLPPGPYTALLSGANNGIGVGLVEVYDRGTP